MIKFFLYFILVASLILFSGCFNDSKDSTYISSDNSQNEDTTEQNEDNNTTYIPEVLYGHTLPPEPNPAINNSTLLGVDSNNNGVRDDVERWIYKERFNKHIPCTEKVVTETLLDGTVVDGIVKRECADEEEPYHQIVREIAMQGARAAQIVIEDPSKAKETQHYVIAAIECEAYIALHASEEEKEAAKLNENIFTDKEFKAKQFNTIERARAFSKYNMELSGTVYRLPKISTLSSKCDFNISKTLSD